MGSHEVATHPVGHPQQPVEPALGPRRTGELEQAVPAQRASGGEPAGARRRRAGEAAELEGETDRRQAVAGASAEHVERRPEVQVEVARGRRHQQPGLVDVEAEPLRQERDRVVVVAVDRQPRVGERRLPAVLLRQHRDGGGERVGRGGVEGGTAALGRGNHLAGHGPETLLHER